MQKLVDFVREPDLESHIVDGRLELTASGNWTALYSEMLERRVKSVIPKLAGVSATSLNFIAVRELDTLGAWLMERLMRAARQGGRPAQLIALPEKFKGLVDDVRAVTGEQLSRPARLNFVFLFLDGVGRVAVDSKKSLTLFITMLGAVWIALLGAMARPRTFRFTPTVHHLHRVGWKAVPIILLITFLIGCIISQQGFFHFRKFGADAYVVDMVGILVLRELGVLIVAIMIAGRSGSSYTAELGAMKMREEIDALQTMGLDPVSVLVLPRVLALIIALPILTFIGSAAALYGAGLVAWLYGDMSPTIFIARLRDAISVTHFEVGMIKSPFMALVIGIVAASEGLAVRGSAESLGLQTTTSVVKAIFFVIVLDGLFAIFFASIGM
jgi:phospholipid/cholesterol/gamma-HCH transport system permease protein